MCTKCKKWSVVNPIKEYKLSSLKIDKEKKIHTRDIKIATYAYDEAHIIVEGELNDNRIIPNFSHTGELYPPGNIHHMFIRLLIEIESIRIIQVEIEMPGIPHQECPETIPIFAKLEGMRIAPGFTSKVRNIIGGPKGCAHLTGLLMAMAPAAFQGLWTYRAKDRQRDTDIEKIANEYLVDTCWVWRQDGPLIDRLSKEDKIS
jgi:hypothetical protein